MSGGGNLLLRPRGALFANITDRGDPAPGNAQEIPQMRPALQPDADDADAGGVDRRRREWAGRPLCGGARPLRVEGCRGRSTNLQEVAPVPIIHADALTTHFNRKPRIAFVRARPLLSRYDRPRPRDWIRPAMEGAGGPRPGRGRHVCVRRDVHWRVLPAELPEPAAARGS